MSAWHTTWWAVLGAAMAAWVSACSDRKPSTPEIPPPCTSAGDTVLVAQDWYPAWSPDGRTIAYQHESFSDSAGPSGIYIVRVYEDSVSKPVRATRPMSYVHWLRFAPDGRRLVYYWGNIFLLDLDTQEVTQLTQGGRVGTPDWHPDGQHILYFGEPRAESPADSGSIRVLDLATGDSHGLRLANGRVVYGGGARWDPSGASFVYTRYDRRTRGSEVFRVWPEPSTEKRLTRRGWTCEFPKWFRNGAEVIFQINPNEIPAPNTADWWVVGASGSEPRPFLNPNVQIKLGYTFDFSPDWSQVVVCRPANCGTYWALWIIRFNETEILEERQITGLPGQLP